MPCPAQMLGFAVTIRDRFCRGTAGPPHRLLACRARQTCLAVPSHKASTVIPRAFTPEGSLFGVNAEHKPSRLTLTAPATEGLNVAPRSFYPERSERAARHSERQEPASAPFNRFCRGTACRARQTCLAVPSHIASTVIPRAFTPEGSLFGVNAGHKPSRLTLTAPATEGLNVAPRSFYPERSERAARHSANEFTRCPPSLPFSCRQKSPQALVDSLNFSSC